MTTTYTVFATFEEATLAAAGWTTAVTGTAIAERYTTAPIVGTASLRLANADGVDRAFRAYKSIAPSLAPGESYCVGFRKKMLGTANIFFALWDNSGVSPYQVGFIRGDNLYSYNDNGIVVAVSHGTTFTVGNTYAIIVEVRRASAAGVADGYMKMWVNGILKMTNVVTNYARAGSLNLMQFGWQFTAPSGVSYLIDSVYADKLSTFDARDLWAVDAGRTGKTSPYIRLADRQAGALATRLFHLPGYQTAGDGVLVDQARVGHGELKNGASFAAATGSWTNAWKGLPYGGKVLSLNGSNHYASIGTLTGCLPAVNAGGISGSFIIRPSNVAGGRVVWGYSYGSAFAYCSLVDGDFKLGLSDGAHWTYLTSDAAIIAENANERIDYSLAPDGTGFVMADGVVVPSTVVLDWPTLVDPTIAIAVGALATATTPSSYFAGEIAEHEVRFGQTMTQGQAQSLYRLSRGMKKRGMLGNLTLGI